ncbi:MAG: HlyC/CorC family transporter [Blastocatellia bacterium]|nr:HlyC/CorC family transporter [Blastocatellia bacterium]
MQIEIIAGFAILIAIVFLSTVDIAFSHLSDVSLRRVLGDAELDDDGSSARFVRQIIQNRARFRLVISSVIQILLISFTVLLTLILIAMLPERSGLFFITIISGVVLMVVLRQVVPRLIVRDNTEKKLLFLLPTVRPLFAIASVFFPSLPSDAARDAQLLDMTTAPDGDDDDDLNALIEVGEAEGIIEEGERELIETMVEFGDTRAGEIMTPRTEICAISIDATIESARDLIIRDKYSRLPVYRDSIDNIEGMVYVRDLLQAWADGEGDTAITSVMRDPFFVPETITADDLLKSMQSNHVQIAIVVDEYGGIAGLVTVEDLLEEIVGEIEDEDTEADEIIEIVMGDDGYWDVVGSTEIEKIERLVNLELEDEDYNTIAGLVISEAGYVPKVGESLDLRGMNIEILRADDKKLLSLRLRGTIGRE